MDVHLNVRIIKECRSCHSPDLKTAFDLTGSASFYVSDFVDKDWKPEEGLRAPLELMQCQNCTLVQLRHTVNPEQMYRNYWYRSFVNEHMRRHLQGIVYDAMGQVTLDKGDLVMDIGANDATLLSFYPHWLARLGFEPSTSLVIDAQTLGAGIVIVPDFFRAHWMRTKFPNMKAKIITSIAMFYDLDDPNGFVQDVKSCLDPFGIWVIEMLYLPRMLQHTAFDAICHEHLEYYDVKSLKFLLIKNGLEIRDIQYNPINGGSFRITVGHPTPSGTSDWRDPVTLYAGIETFGSRIEEIRIDIRAFLEMCHKLEKEVWGYGASTKANTFLQYCQISPVLLPLILDRSEWKRGLKTVGTNIIIRGEETFHAIVAGAQLYEQSTNPNDDRPADPLNLPDFLLVLIWQFQETVIKREMEYLKKGGKMVFAMPHPEIVSWERGSVVKQHLREWMRSDWRKKHQK